MSTLEKAIAFAAKAHAGQVDKLGQPYILHPLRVMMAVPKRARIVAVLHDVIEDTTWGAFRALAAGFSEIDVAAVESVSRRPGETYEAFILRCAADPLSRMVKLADIDDNLDPARFSLLLPDMQERLGPRYRAAREVLTARA